MTAEIRATIPENVEEILARIGDAFVILDCEWRYTYVNHKLAQLAQINQEDFLGKSIWDLYPQAVNSILYTEMHRAVAQKITVNFEYLDPIWHRWLEYCVYPGENGVSILITDITEQKRHKQLLSAHQTITQILAEATVLANAVPLLLRSLCETLGWQLGIFWSVDEKINTLYPIGSWHSSDLSIEVTQVFNQPANLALGEKLTSQPAWICELTSDENLFAAAMELPIVLGNKLLGAMKFFTNQILQPDSDLLQTMSAIALQIGQFMEQQRTNSLLQAVEEKYHPIVETANVGISQPNSIQTKNLTSNFTEEQLGTLEQCLAEQQTALRHRQQVEENLRRSEARYRSLAQASASIIWSAAPWGNVIDEIPTWQAFTGQSLEQYKGWGWVDALHPEDRKSVAAMWRQAFYGRSVAVAEYRLRRHDGEYRYMAIRGVPIVNETGKITEWVGMCVDITEGKQAQTERERLLALLEIEQNRLLEANVLLDTLFTNAPIGIGVWDEKLRFVRLNHALAEINGLPEDMHIGKTIAELLPGVHQEVTEAFRHVVKTGESISQETSGETPAAPGKQRYWSVNYYPIPLPSKITWVGAICQEITERKQAQDKQRFLAEASEILAASLDYETTLASLARLVVPEIADWCVIDMICENKSMRRVAAFHADPAKQELVEQLQNYPPNLAQAKGVAEVIRSGKSQIIHFIASEQIQALTSNANHFQILQQLNPQSGMCVLLVVRGRVLGALSLVSSTNHRYDSQSLMLAEELARRAAIAVDNARLYTETQQSQQAAEQAASRTARLLAITAALSESLTSAQVAEVIVEQGIAALGASSALVALLTNNGTELQIIRAVGYKEELVNSWRRFSINTAAPLAEAVRTKQPIWQESTPERAARYSHLAKEYSQYNYGAWISIPLTIEGRAIGGMTVAFAENKQLSQDDRAFMLALAQQCAQAMERARLYEIEQTAREAAENANRIKDEFLAVLSHELRSPLNPILGWSKLLQTRKLDEKTIPQALKTIERNAQLQAQLIEDLLDISRILQGKLSLNILPVDLVGVISAAMETVRLSAEAKSIKIHINLEPNLEPVLGDSSRLQQVIWNLLSNAVKFTPEGGRVDIRLEKVERWGDGEMGSNNLSPVPLCPSAPVPLLPYAQITVTDTGKGIAPSFLPYVFEYFRQENSTTTRKFGGLGLGLAIVRHLVELHGGTVQVQSAGENCGATFTVRLPLIQQPPESQQDINPSEPSSNLNDVTILVVDDDADTREFIVFLLEEYGASVTAVPSANEALAALKQSLPDVLLSDIGMPDVDGCMFMRELRKLPPQQGGQIPAIALTAYAGEVNAKQVLAAGYNKHIAKPVEPAELIDAIASLYRLHNIGQ
ncbi:MAG: PAS domain-containing protein [Nostoc sp. GBBB01]|nr:PAS domain-containing protein [Nostoc sp. GBBB01]